MKNILQSFNVSELRNEIKKLSNDIKKPFSGYSTMKKANLIELMIKYKQHFGHLKKAEPKIRKLSKPQIKKLELEKNILINNLKKFPKLKNSLKETLKEKINKIDKLLSA